MIRSLSVTPAIALALLLAACSPSPQAPAEPKAAPPAPPAHAAIGAWGFDLDGMDKTAKPGDDFYKYANGHWLTGNQIPPDLTSWGAFSKLSVDTDAQVHDIVEAVAAGAPAGSPEQKVHDFYRSYLDTAAIERAGIAPATAALQEIANAKTHADVARLMGRPDLGIDTPVNVQVTIDEKHPDRYIVAVSQGGIGLPDRDYYLKNEASLVQIRTKYQAHMERMLKLAGDTNGAQEAKAILALETQIAKRHWPAAKRRERDLTYNPRTRAELEKFSGTFPWGDMLAPAGLQDQREFVVSELDAVQALAAFFTSVPVETWRSYMRYHFLSTHGAVLPLAFDDENFDFYGRTLNGLPQRRDRWKRAVTALDGSLGELVGQLYVKQHFPADSKAQMLALVENLRKAYMQRIEGLPWMSEETKQAAMEKLRTFRPKIGYPDKWKDYSKLDIRAGDAFGNAVRARVFGWEYDVNRLGKPTDKDEWFITPQTVNAYYNATFNEIVFPAAILQPPYFDPHADPAVNYGGIGGVIGHEMGHGFDDQGAKSDAYGVLRTWWQSADEKEFKKLVDALVGQYDGYQALPGLKLNGRLTVGENIGDLGGLTVALTAYHLSLDGKTAPVLDGFSGDQRFFLGWAQVWRELQRDEAMRNQVMSNPHSPALFRVQGVVRNMDPWYAAFDVKPEDKMFLAPPQRVRIW